MRQEGCRDGNKANEFQATDCKLKKNLQWEKLLNINFYRVLYVKSLPLNSFLKHLLIIYCIGMCSIVPLWSSKNSFHKSVLALYHVTLPCDSRESQSS